MYARLVNGDYHLSAERIELSNELSLYKSTYGRIPGHLCKRIEIDDQQQCHCSQSTNGESGLTASMAGTDDDYIKAVGKFHRSPLGELPLGGEFVAGIEFAPHDSVEDGFQHQFPIETALLARSVRGVFRVYTDILFFICQHIFCLTKLVVCSRIHVCCFYKKCARKNGVEHCLGCSFSRGCKELNAAAREYIRLWRAELKTEEKIHEVCC